MISIIFLSFCLFFCSKKQVKSDLTPEIIGEAFEGSYYSTWCHTVNEEDKDFYKYHSELKVYNPDNEARDYIFI